MSKRHQKNKTVFDFLLFSGLIIFSVIFFIITITLKNECVFMQNEVHHLESIKNSHLNRVKVLSGKAKNLSRQDRIEELANKKFKLQIPSPESLIVYLGELK